MTPLHMIGQFFRDLLGAIPLPAVRLLFLATIAAVFLWTMWLPASATQPPGGAKRWDENLKLGAAIALGLQFLIYLCL